MQGYNGSNPSSKELNIDRDIVSVFYFWLYFPGTIPLSYFPGKIFDFYETLGPSLRK